MLGFRVTVITLGNGLMQVVISPLYRAINLKQSGIENWDPVNLLLRSLNFVIILVIYIYTYITSVMVPLVW